MKTRLAVLATVSAAALVPAAQTAARPQTTAPPPVVEIRVTISDSGIRFAPAHAVRGAYARFILVNVGARPHTLALGARKKAAGVQTGFTKLLKPKEQKVLLLFLDFRGRVPYLAPLPHDRGKPGMKGVFTIT